MLIGVLSDTHGTLPRAAFAELADCDRIVHAGDIGDPGILVELAGLAPVTAVLGNNDFREYGPDVDRVARPVIGGVPFLVAHTPDDLMRELMRPDDAAAPGSPAPRVAVHGHTHVPKIVSGRAAAPAARIVCPGSVTRPRGGSEPSVAKIVVEDGALCSVRLVPLA